jgi:hypothetical protein
VSKAILRSCWKIAKGWRLSVYPLVLETLESVLLEDKGPDIGNRESRVFYSFVMSRRCFRSKGMSEPHN